MIADIADLLDGLELFTAFSYAELKAIARHMEMLRKTKGEVIFNEGDPGDYMLILAEGKLAVFKGGENGSQLLSYEGRGRMVGEMALLDHERRSATCVADSDCTFLTLNSAGLEEMAREFPLLAYRFTHALARLLSRRLRKTSGMLVEFMVG